MLIAAFAKAKILNTSSILTFGLGFLPKKRQNRLFKWLKDGPSTSSGRRITFAFYESPYRILKTLTTLEKVFGGHTRVFIARELTKIHETLYRGKISQVHELLQNDKVRGELVVIVEL